MLACIRLVNGFLGHLVSARKSWGLRADHSPKSGDVRVSEFDHGILGLPCLLKVNEAAVTHLCRFSAAAEDGSPKLPLRKANTPACPVASSVARSASLLEFLAAIAAVAFFLRQGSSHHKNLHAAEMHSE